MTGTTTTYWIKARAELPALNHAVLEGQLDLPAMTARFAEPIRRVCELGAAPRVVVATVAAVVSSVENHYLLRGAPSGTSLRVLPDAERAVLTLAGRADPPREVLSDMWTENLRFTELAAEQLFAENAYRINGLYRAALEALSPLLEPNSWDGDDATARLRKAAEHLGVAQRIHLDQARARPELRREFRDVVRNFFRGRPVDGIDYEGINAAHAVDVACADVILGTDDHRYRGPYLTAVRRHTVSVDRARFDRYMAAGSLRGALCERLGIRELDELDEPDRHDDGEAPNHSLPPTLVDNMAAYAELLRTHSSVAGAHHAVIKNVLLSSDQENIVRPTSPDFGSGGRPHAHTISLVRMRRRAAMTMHRCSARYGRTAPHKSQAVRNPATTSAKPASMPQGRRGKGIEEVEGQ